VISVLKSGLSIIFDGVNLERLSTMQ